MMGRLKSDQGQLFYEFHLRDAVPEDHLARKIDAALDLSWVRSEIAAHYSSTGRPSVDPEAGKRRVDSRSTALQELGWIDGRNISHVGDRLL